MVSCDGELRSESGRRKDVVKSKRRIIRGERWRGKEGEEKKAEWIVILPVHSAYSLYSLNGSRLSAMGRISFSHRLLGCISAHRGCFLGYCTGLRYQTMGYSAPR